MILCTCHLTSDVGCLPILQLPYPMCIYNTTLRKMYSRDVTLGIYFTYITSDFYIKYGKLMIKPVKYFLNFVKVTLVPQPQVYSLNWLMYRTWNTLPRTHRGRYSKFDNKSLKTNGLRINTMRMKVEWTIYVHESERSNYCSNIYNKPDKIALEK